MTWIRHSASDERWHAVASVDSGSIATLCNGRMSETDDYEIDERPSRADRCSRCQVLAGQRARVDAGLAELATAEYGGEAL